MHYVCRSTKLLTIVVSQKVKMIHQKIHLPLKNVHVDPHETPVIRLIKNEILKKKQYEFGSTNWPNK